MVAVMTPEMSPSEMTFGRKATVISNIMQSDWSWTRRGRTERRDQKDALYDACYPAVGANANTPANEMKARRREKLTLDALDGVVTDLGSLRDERKAILTVSDGWVLFRENQDLAAAQKGRDQGSLVDRLLRRPSKEKSDERQRRRPKDEARKTEARKTSTTSSARPTALRSPAWTTASGCGR